MQRSKWAVFLSDDWGVDSLKRCNHSRVGRVNTALKGAGFRTWYDAEQMSGDIVTKIVEGIDNSSTVAVFITYNYLNKVVYSIHTRAKRLQQ